MLKTARFPSICVSLAIAVVALPIRAAATPKAEPSSLDDRTFQIGSSITVTADPLVARPQSLKETTNGLSSGSFASNSETSKWYCSS